MAEVLTFNDKTLINYKAKVKQQEPECPAFANALDENGINLRPGLLNDCFFSFKSRFT